MSSCTEMKIDEVYVCEDCGLELKVVKECDSGAEGACACGCVLSCCEKPLTRKQ
jgi:hypothetical protein